MGWAEAALAAPGAWISEQVSPRAAVLPDGGCGTEVMGLCRKQACSCISVLVLAGHSGAPGMCSPQLCLSLPHVTWGSQC